MLHTDIIPQKQSNIRPHGIFNGCYEVMPCTNNNSALQIKTRHRASTSTCRHFAFSAMLSQQWNRAPIANLPNNAQLEGTATILQLTSTCVQ